MPSAPKHRSSRRRPARNTDPIAAPHSLLFAGRSPDEDRLLTTVLLAAEALAAGVAPAGSAESSTRSVVHAQPDDDAAADLTEDSRRLAGLARHIQAWLEEDTGHIELLDRIPRAFGFGESLRALFCGLFPDSRPPPATRESGEPILSPREVEVLELAAGDRPHEKIARNLGVTTNTVHTHFRRIYKKLGVDRPMRAAARATSLGYLDPDRLWSGLETARYNSRWSSQIRQFCTELGDVKPPFAPNQVNPLAGFGLLLMALGGARARLLHSAAGGPYPRGAAAVLAPDGEIRALFQPEGMGATCSIAVAPAMAKERGFTPGNLFVAYDLHPQQGLNRGAIVEMTPAGGVVRRFCGGRDVGHRLVGPLGLTFAPDGRHGLSYARGARSVEAQHECYIGTKRGSRSELLTEGGADPRVAAVGAALDRQPGLRRHER